MVIHDTVIQGRGLGKKLGYPTANLAQSHGIAGGIYRVSVIPVKMGIHQVIRPGARSDDRAGTPRSNLDPRPKGLRFVTNHFVLGQIGSLRGDDREEVDGNDIYDGILIVGAFTKSDGMPAEEVYILDFAGDLYGQEITVEVFEKIRDMQTFRHDEELKIQIQKDIAYVHRHHSA